MPLAVPDGRPEPDVALAATSARAHPSTAYLVIEVVVSTHPETWAKLPGYAAAGVTEAWLVDVPSRTVEVFTEAAGREYHEHRTLRAGDTLDARVEGVAPIAVADLFAVLDA